jgi:hypothetical protein
MYIIFAIYATLYSSLNPVCSFFQGIAIPPYIIAACTRSGWLHFFSVTNLGVLWTCMGENHPVGSFWKLTCFFNKTTGLKHNFPTNSYMFNYLHTLSYIHVYLYHIYIYIIYIYDLYIYDIYIYHIIHIYIYQYHIYIYSDGLKLRMSRFFPKNFTQKIEPDPFRGVLGAT